jgi:hypothetical protein
LDSLFFSSKKENRSESKKKKKDQKKRSLHTANTGSYSHIRPRLFALLLIHLSYQPSSLKGLIQANWEVGCTQFVTSQFQTFSLKEIDPLLFLTFLARPFFFRFAAFSFRLLTPGRGSLLISFVALQLPPARAIRVPAAFAVPEHAAHAVTARPDPAASR